MAISHHQYQPDQVSDRAEGTPPTFRERVHGLQLFFSSNAIRIIIGLGAAAGGYLFYQGKEGVVGKKTDRPSFIAGQMQVMERQELDSNPQSEGWRRLMGGISGSLEHESGSSRPWKSNDVMSELLQQISNDLGALRHREHERYSLETTVNNLVPLAGQLRNRAAALPEGHERVCFERLSLFCDALAVALHPESSVTDLIDLGKGQLALPYEQNGHDEESDLLTRLREEAPKLLVPAEKGENSEPGDHQNRLVQLIEQFMAGGLMGMNILRDLDPALLSQSLQDGADPEKVHRLLMVYIANALKRGIPLTNGLVQEAIGRALEIESKYLNDPNGGPPRSTITPVMGAFTVGTLLEKVGPASDRHVSSASPRTSGQ